MTSLNRLQSRKDIDNADIPEIIERAERLRQKHIAYLEQEKKRSSVQEVKQVGRDLSIPDNFIEQAIAELRDERRSAQKESDARLAKNTRMKHWISKGILLMTLIVGVMIVLRGVQWLWFALDFTPERAETTVPEVIVQERIVKETAVRTVQETVISKQEPITNDLPPTKEPDELSSLSAVVKTEEAVETKIPEESASIPSLAKDIEGEWVLDAYLLYEKGVELPMEVPIVYEPLEVPKTWRFTNGKYKRVMDTDLSFTARFEMVTLPTSIRPNLDEQGQWGQIVASNVVSSIPGIRRQNDYFAVLLGKDTLTIWYLGPNAYRKKVPTQAERYVRK